VSKFYDFCHRRARCSCWFDGWFGKDWAKCCLQHDIDYIVQSHGMSKSEVDLKLFRCVRERGGVIMASIMYLGNKTFSWFYWNKYSKDK